MAVRLNKLAPHKLAYAKLVSLMVIPIVLLVLPASFFDEGQSICLSVLLFDMKCYGCGMTKALMHLIHLDFPGAHHHHALSFVVLPLFIYLWITWFWQALKSIRDQA